MGGVYANGAACLAIVLPACSPAVGSVGRFDETGATIGSAATGGGAGSGSAGGSMQKLDAPMGDAPSDCAGDECLGCTAVDLLFVVDDSVSMGGYQDALAEAFPAFADAIVEELPGGTSVHVGVTSTTFGDSSAGMTMNCVATGDNGQPVDAFYTTPDQGSTGVNGAQGRLFEANGTPWYALSTAAGPGGVPDLAAWFSAAARIGESGSQIEMSAAAAGWAADPANDATNAGFIRDEGAVLVLFFIQDEPDQSPPSAADDLVEKIAAAKAGCGGFDCVVGGGFVRTSCLDQVPLGAILGAINEPVVQDLPIFDDLATPQLFEGVLRDTLAQVIGQKCDEIPPAP